MGALANALLRYYEWWLFEAFRVSARGLACFRMAFAGFLMVLALPSYRWVSDFPDAFFAPPMSLAMPLDGFPPPFFFEVLSLVLAFGVVLLFFGWQTRFVSVLLTLVAFTGQTFAYSFGKIDHDITLLWTLPLVMAFSGWGRCISADAYRPRYASGDEAMAQHTGAQCAEQQRVEAWPVALMATIVAVGFLSAGLPKLFGWIDFDLATQGVRDWVFSSYYGKGRQDYLTPWLVQTESPLFWEMLDVSAVAFELTFFLSLAVPRLFKAYCCIAVLFHVANYFMLNIAFVMLFPVYMLFLPWTRVAERLAAAGYLKSARAWMRPRVATFTAAACLPLAWVASQFVPSATPAPPSSLLRYQSATERYSISLSSRWGSPPSLTSRSDPLLFGAGALPQRMRGNSPRATPSSAAIEA